MSRGLWRYERSLIEATRWAYRAMFPRRETRCGRKARLRAKQEMRRLFRWVRELVAHAADSCLPEPRRIAMRFCSHLRFGVYQRIVEDETGRIAQLATVCPGALIFAFGLIEHKDAAAKLAGERVFADVVAGRRLGDVLDDAVAAWVDVANRTCEQSEDFSSERFIWAPVAYASPTELESVRHRQRLLIRRAGPAVPTTMLWLPPPVAFAPEDIPVAVRANARWYRCMKSHPILFGARHTRYATNCPDLAMFASRNAARLMAEPAVPRSSVIGWLLDYLVTTDGKLGGTSNASRLLGECRRWHQAMAGEHAPTDLGKELEEHGLGSTSFPPPPFPASTSGRAKVRPITSAGELFDEGRRMRHCVFSLLSQAARGDVFIYSAEIDGQAATLCVEPTGSGFRISEAKGTANRTLLPFEWRRIHAWFRAACFSKAASGIQSVEGRDGTDSCTRVPEAVNPHRTVNPYHLGKRIPPPM